MEFETIYEPVVRYHLIIIVHAEEQEIKVADAGISKKFYSEEIHTADFITLVIQLLLRFTCKINTALQIFKISKEFRIIRHPLNSYNYCPLILSR